MALSLALPKSMGTMDEGSGAGGGGPRGGIITPEEACGSRGPVGGTSTKPPPLGQLIMDASEIAPMGGTGPTMLGGLLAVPFPMMTEALRGPSGAADKAEEDPFVHGRSADGPSPRLSCPGIALCWSHNKCAFLRLDRTAADAASGGSGAVEGPGPAGGCGDEDDGEYLSKVR